jgi:hypothetical protein
MNGGDLPTLAASTLVAAAMTDVWATARDGLHRYLVKVGPIQSLQANSMRLATNSLRSMPT